MRGTDTRIISTGSGGENRDQETHHYYYGCCMGPPGLGPRAMTMLWGAGLSTIGAAWLVANTFDIENWGEWFMPIVLLGIGLVTILSRRP